MDVYAKQKGQIVCGVYHANESPTNKAIPNHVESLATTIAKANALEVAPILLVSQ